MKSTQHCNFQNILWFGTLLFTWSLRDSILLTLTSSLSNFIFCRHKKIQVLDLRILVPPPRKTRKNTVNEDDLVYPSCQKWHVIIDRAWQKRQTLPINNHSIKIMWKLNSYSYLHPSPWKTSHNNSRNSNHLLSLTTFQALC